MHIAIAGPISLTLLSDYVEIPQDILGYPFPGTAQLAAKFLGQGHRVSIVTTSPVGVSQSRQFTGDHIDVTIVQSRPRARARALDLFRLERELLTNALNDTRADVCHAHWTYEFALAAQATDLPLLITVHDWAPRVARNNRHPYWWFRAVMQAQALSGRGTFAAPSPYIQHRVEQWYRTECHLVPNGIPLNHFPPPRPGHNLNHLPPVLGMLNVGSSRRKNIRRALLALARVSHTLPVTVELAGPDYEMGGPVFQWARDRALDRCFRFVGPIAPSEVPKWMADLDVFVHPSLEESFGLVLVEAMAAGTPIVAGKRSGAVPWLVGDSGCLTNVRRVHELQAAILDLLGDLSRRQELAARGRIRAQDFSVDAMAGRYLELLDSAQ